MQVVKLGGSLEKSQVLAACLAQIVTVSQIKPIVIVPGGGLFADQVRLAQATWQFDDVTAHGMAILAMQQMALLMNALCPNAVLAESVAAIKPLLARQSPVIWSPSLNELNAAGVAASWEVTSDSLSAWLATQLAAEHLCVVKSVAIAANASVAELAAQQIIDAAFPLFTADADYSLSIIHHADLLAYLA